MYGTAERTIGELSERLVDAADRAIYDVLQALPVAIYVTDAVGRITFYNEAAVAFSGRRPVIGSDSWCVTWRLYRPDGTPLPHDECPMAVCLKQGRPVRGEWAIAERPDGTRVPFAPYPTPLRNAAGELTGAINLLLDLTEHKRAEEALLRFNEALELRVSERTRELTEAVRRLQESEQRFRLLVEGVTDYALYMLDPGGIVTNWNPGAQRIKGYRADEVLGRHFSMFYTEEDQRAGAPARALATATRDGRFEIEAWRARKGGERFWAGVVLDAIRDETGALVGFAKITRDLTERRAIEEQLRQAQKMEAVGQLTGGIAHDFNNLLGTIVPSLELARMRVQDPTVLGYIDGAARAAERGAKLTHQLLGFSRRQELVITAVDVNTQVGELATALLPRVLPPTMEIALAPASGPLFAMTDASQLESALLNLAINARDAMPLGGTLTIRTQAVDAAEARRAGLPETGRYVAVAVADTGTGMTDVVRERAFEPFYTTKPTGKGSGLGLSMVYGFARQSGGVATIESRLGAGTTVRLYLPMADATAMRDDRADGEPLDAGRAARLLVVDDDRDVRTIAGAVLRDFGHETVEADSGDAALALLARDRRFDAMLVDLMMPNMHGSVFAMRARSLLPDVPILFMTGYDDAPWPGSATNESVLRKPFRRGELAARLRGMLDTARPPH